MNYSRHRLTALLVFVGSLLAHSGHAQVFAPPPPPTVIRPDTTERREVTMTAEAKRNKAAADSAKRTERMFRAFGFQGIRLTRPGKAALLAVVLPGAGQIYNRRWWKLPLVYGGLGGVIYGEYFYQTAYREYADAYNKIIDRVPNKRTGAPFKVGDIELGPRASTARSVDVLNRGIVFYRGNRDLFYLYIGLVYSLQVVDALVDAHLRDFDVSDDLSLHWEPAMLSVPGQYAALPTTPGFRLALRVK